jgi:NTE family protein
MRLYWPNKPVALALALQGGGAHGAYTWGVLDRLLEIPGLRVEAISGASAGAMNAAALAQGLLDGGPERARESLQRFWSAVGTRVPFELFTVGPADRPGLNPAARVFMHWTRLFSPTLINPLGLNPLRDVVNEQFDFDRLRSPDAVQLHVAATHVNSGRLRVFANESLTADVMLASACLPSMLSAVEIDGEPYWDGGYSANPPLFPLLDARAADLLIVALTPLTHGQVPVTAEKIRERELEFAFNSAFLLEAQLLGAAIAMARRSWLGSGHLERRLRRMRTHLVDADADLGALPGETRMIAHLPFLETLRDLGRARADRWLDAHRRQLGRASTVDLAQVFAAPRAA